VAVLTVVFDIGIIGWMLLLHSKEFMIPRSS
jgi:hypothetical protein